MSELNAKMSTRTVDESVWYEGTINLPGCRPTKLIRKTDGSTRFATKAALTTAAKAVATSLGFETVDWFVPTARAAKRSPRPSIAHPSYDS